MISSIMEKWRKCYKEAQKPLICSFIIPNHRQSGSCRQPFGKPMAATFHHFNLSACAFGSLRVSQKAAILMVSPLM